ncbi:MAG: HTTM domain-containing protein [Gemmataceae bacterium]|nr:HTTM domain-containing protein [Gemmataceae bacterium]
MSERKVVGIRPWLPWPLSRIPWWTEPVRAERLAALRIGVGLATLVDVLGHYLPYASAFFGDSSLGASAVFDAQGMDQVWRWSVLRGIHDPTTVKMVLLVWAAVAAGLAAGVGSRLCAFAAWVLGMSFFNLNPFLVNSGDNVRNFLCFYLMLSPCGAAWSVDHWWARQRGAVLEPVFVQPWALRLVFVQMTVLYFMTGVWKLRGGWHSGESPMHYVFGNLGWTRVSYAQLPLPVWAVDATTWITLIWELGFPVLVFMTWTRTLTLWMGVLFHLGTGCLLQLGPFPLYMLCLYLPLVPWEQYISHQNEKAAAPMLAAAAAFAPAGPEDVKN